MKFSSRAVLLCGFMLFQALTVCPAGAAPEPSGNFFAFNYGKVKSGELDSSDGTSFNYERGNAYSAAWGGQVGPLRLNYRLTRSIRNFTARESGGSENQLQGKLEELFFNLDIYEHRSLPGVPGQFGVFGLLGAGLGRIEMNGVRSGGSLLYDSHDSPVSYRAGLGLDLKLFVSSYLSLTFLYETTDDLSFNNPAGDGISFDSLQSRKIMLEYRWFY